MIANEIDREHNKPLFQEIITVYIGTRTFQSFPPKMTKLLPAEIYIDSYFNKRIMKLLEYLKHLINISFDSINQPMNEKCQ